MDMTCTISGCNSEAKVKMFHYSYDKEIQDYVCIGTIFACEKHTQEISKKSKTKILQNNQRGPHHSLQI